MAGLYHDFLLLKKEDRRSSNYYMGFIGDPRAIRLSDDLIEYIDDTLDWVPTFNPAKKKSRHGLCLCGITEIHAEGASVLASILDAWAQVFGYGPRVLSLTGEWATEEDMLLNEGKYETLSFNRDETVAALSKLADCARRVVATDGEHFILHLGI